jgi:hypothetical protein
MQEPPEGYQSDVFFLGPRDMAPPEPLPDINESIKKIDELKKGKVPEFSIISLSARSGKKFYVTIDDDFTIPLSPEDFVEIIDYDPVRNSALAIGTVKPNEYLPLHWFTYRAFPNVSGIAVIKLLEDVEVPQGMKIATAERDINVFKPEIVLEILPLMKDTTFINLKAKGLVFFNESFEGLIEDIMGFLKKLPETETRRIEVNAGVERESEDK